MNELDTVLNSYSGEVVELVQSLVRYPSVLKPPHGNEKECQMFVASWLQEYCDLVDVFELPEAPGFLEHPAHWKYNDYAERPDVIGVVHGSGGGKSLLFNGHVDVVPEDPLPWIHAPFGAEVTNNRIYGRGAWIHGKGSSGTTST